MKPPAIETDVAIVGAGPAGCSCALWLSEFGLRCTVIDRAPVLCSLPAGFSFAQNWVLGQPHRSLGEIVQGYAAHIESEPGIERLLGSAVQQVARTQNGLCVDLFGGAQVQARAVVVATGLLPRRPPAFFVPGGAAAPVLDAIGLTQQRESLRGQKLLLLGGGDNAVENAIFLHDRGNHVTLWSRSPLRASKALADALLQRSGVVCRIGFEMPESLQPDGQQTVAHSARFGAERFDRVAVLFGFEPNLALLDTLAPEARAGDQWPGLFLAGDVSQRLHPSIQCALADGVTAAKLVQAWLQPANRELPMPTIDTAPASQGRRILTLTGLRFDANLGILEHERNAPQPIQVDAELNLGLQLLLPRVDEIHHVLDYRKVRQIIITECTAEHTDLLESLIGKLSARLMQLPGVRGVRVKVAKLKIFDDCEVAIRVETGDW